MNFLPVLIVILGSTVVHADSAIENERIVSQALSAFDSDYQSSWAYTRTAIKGDKPAIVGYFDPRQPAAKKWTLVSIGDRAPTTKEKDAWALRRIKEDEDNKGGIAKIVTPGSVQLLEESASHWMFSFTPSPDVSDDKKTRKLISQVTGMLRVKKAGHYVEEIFLSNDKPFHPTFGVKIELFEMRRTYGPNLDGGPVVLLRVDTHIQGRAFLAASFDDVKKVRFSDYVKVDFPQSRGHFRTMIDPSGRMKDRLRFEGYRSGHMIYLRREDLKTATEHIRQFIQTATPADGQAAKY